MNNNLFSASLCNNVRMYKWMHKHRGVKCLFMTSSHFSVCATLVNFFENRLNMNVKFVVRFLTFK